MATFTKKSEQMADARTAWQEQTEKVYSDLDLFEFDKEMQKYKSRKTYDGTEYDSYDTEKFLVDKSAISYKDYMGKPIRQVVLTGGQAHLEVYENKIEQWKKWRGRKEYGRKMRDAELEKLSSITYPTT